MKILDCGVAIVEHDTHVGVWIAQQKRLDIAADMLRPFSRHVPYESTVIDIGANVGDHTVTYADWVGPDGRVFAFEPNKEAFDCLVYNTRGLANVLPFNQALADAGGSAELVKSDNVGASYLTGDTGSTQLHTLDVYGFRDVSFIKIDVEGWEVRVLAGAAETIAVSRPVMLIEVNAGALERAGTSRHDLLRAILRLGYTYKITDPRLKLDAPQFDVICEPNWVA